MGSPKLEGSLAEALLKGFLAVFQLVGVPSRRFPVGGPLEADLWKGFPDFPLEG
jgi:hypothetical protein